MPWKIVDGVLEIKDENPVWIHEDGKEVPFDAKHALSNITKLNKESQAHREAREAADTRLKLFEGIDDPENARKAIDTMKNLSAGELKTAAQVEEIQKEAQKAAAEQVRAASEANSRKMTELSKERDTYRDSLFSEKVGGAFTRSKFVTEKVAVPVDMLQSMFGGRFKIEDNKVIGHDNAGNKIYSRVRAGEIADFDEALETIVEGYAYRDSILKGTGSTGSGAQPQNRGAGGANSITRGEFNKLSPTQQFETIKTKTVVD